MNRILVGDWFDLKYCKIYATENVVEGCDIDTSLCEGECTKIVLLLRQHQWSLLPTPQLNNNISNIDILSLSHSEYIIF